MKNSSYVFVLALSILLLFNVTGYAQHSNPCDSALPANLLNSERIEKKFGGYGIDVLYNSARLRVSNLYDGKRITRTLAIVDYPETIDSSFSKEHQTIVNGGSIGSVFKANGWKIEKKTLYIGELSPSADYNKLYALMGNIQPTKLSVWMYVFNIRKDGKAFPYATISEIYHPDYLKLEDLKCINKDADTYLERTKPVSHELKKATKLMRLNFKEQAVYK